MSVNIVGREYKPGDEFAIVELLKKVFPHWQSQVNPIEYWRCKYPPSKTRTFVCEANGKIIGSVSYVQCGIKIGSISHVASFGDDLATDPNFRGMGVTKTFNAPRDPWEKEIGLDLSYVITTNPIVVESARRANAKELPYRLDHLILIKDIKLYIKKKKLNPTLVQPGLSLLKSVSTLSSRRIDHRHAFEIIEKTFDEGINTFWEKARNQFDFVVEKNLDHLSWRYQKGLGEYKIFQAVEDGEVIGFMVLENKREDDYVEGYITDLISLPGKSNVCLALLDEALRYFSDKSVNAIHYRGIKGQSNQQMLKSMGFITPPRAIDVYLILYYKDARMHEPLYNSKPDRLYFNYGDYL